MMAKRSTTFEVKEAENVKIFLLPHAIAVLFFIRTRTDYT